MMLLRLILCVLLAAIGCQPAAAMPCHGEPDMRMTMAMLTGTPTEQHHEAMPAHACLGCIPPETLRASVLPAPHAMRTPPVARALATLDRAADMPPALPPPRT